MRDSAYAITFRRNHHNSESVVFLLLRYVSEKLLETKRLYRLFLEIIRSDLYSVTEVSVLLHTPAIFFRFRMQMGLNHQPILCNTETRNISRTNLQFE
ncbi:hypothetical protein TNCT_259791 [Trichonephila clavata]|uniref:Uncharacterized protein n=1 Tax=Trichonephila clavata TaxID=2740835 RepID=A0A8X6HBC0_TRICU|nr:hypothetical protein TNCT_259791 [Trichonephila clavata]